MNAARVEQSVIRFHLPAASTANRCRILLLAAAMSALLVGVGDARADVDMSGLHYFTALNAVPNSTVDPQVAAAGGGVSTVIANPNIHSVAVDFFTRSAAVPQVQPAGSAQAWGNNNKGQVGDGTTFLHYGPVPVSGLTSGVAATAVGGTHSLAVQNGAAYAWGYNLNGQLGDGTTVDKHAPVTVSGLTSGVTAVTAGDSHSLAIKNGAVLAWGNNFRGELGNGTNTDRSTPGAVTTLTSGVTSVSAGANYSLAVRTGALYAWGDNQLGELGDGTTTDRNIPTLVPGMTSGVTSIAAGNAFSLAVKNGAVYGWGTNGSGQLGDGTVTQHLSPVAAIGSLTSGVTSIAAGTAFGLAVRGGGVYAWGRNEYGQLGNGTTGTNLTPTQVDPTDLNNIVAVAAAQISSYALSSDGSLWSWGYGGLGELGLGDGATYYTPQHLLPPTGYVFTSINASALGDHAVATLAATPEPASLGLVAVAACSLLARPRLRGCAKGKMHATV